MNASTIFSEDPVSMAKHWIEEGGRRLHVVDLDGAFAGRPKNERLISENVLPFLQTYKSGFTTLVGVSLGNPFNHKQVDFLEGSPNSYGWTI